jgi:hypothetical protein
MRRFHTAVTFHRAWPVGLALAFVLSMVLSTFVVGGGPLGALLGGGGGGGASTAYGATLGSGSGAAQPVTQRVPTVHATAHWSRTLPPRSAAEKQAEANALKARQQLEPAPMGPRTNMKPADPRTVSPPLPTSRYSVQHPPASATTARTAPGGPLGDSAFSVELYSSPLSNGNGICASDCSTFELMDASVANAGKEIMMVGNYFAATSTDDGNSWGAIDPYLYFAALGHGHFAGDQQVLYEPSRDRLWWVAETFNGYGSSANGLWLLSAAGNNLSAWCGWWLSGPTFGLPSGTWLTLPQIEYSANFLYLTWTSRDGTGGWLNTGLARFPLSSLSLCSFASPSYVLRTDQAYFELAQGATDTMYWASNWYTSGSGNGSAARFYFWGEHTNSYTYQDKSIPAYNTGVTGDCASQDGVVTDFCLRLQPRGYALFRSRAGFKGFGAPMLGYFIQAGPTSSSYDTCDPFPYVEAVYFLLANMTLKQTENYYNCGYAVTWPSAAAPAQRGYIGVEFVYGGGIGTGGSAVDYYPDDFFMILDTDIPNAPGATWFDSGRGNPVDWGDYTTVRPWNPDQLHWIAAGWYMDGTTAIPEVVIFGKGRDHLSYVHWANT